jgi:hypothetical protein
MAVVGPDRFDDVEYRVLEEPEPPRRPRLRRWTLTALSAVLATATFAGGASALTGSEPAQKLEGWESYGPVSGDKGRDGRDCDRWKRHRGPDRNLELKY